MEIEIKYVSFLIVKIAITLIKELDKMILPTKGRYGTRAMLDLAINYGEGPVLLRDIAKGQEISEKYLKPKYYSQPKYY